MPRPPLPVLFLLLTLCAPVTVAFPGDGAAPPGEGPPGLGVGDLWLGGAFSVSGYSTPLGRVVTEQDPGLALYHSIRAGRDGLMYVCAWMDGTGVFRLDASTGALVDQLVSEADGVLDPYDVAFGPEDGLLYVLNRGEVFTPDDFVTRHDPVTGALVDVFIADDPDTPELENAGLDGGVALAFGPDGNLYVTGEEVHGALRFDGHTGQLIDLFAADSPTWFGHTSIAFRHGFLYLCSPLPAAVHRFDQVSGAYVDTIVQYGGPVQLPRRFCFVPDGDLLVYSESLELRITRHDPLTGAFLELLVDGPYVSSFDAVLPAVGPGDATGDGRVDVADLVLVIAHWGACPAGLPCPADLDGDGAVGALDLVEVIVHWMG